MLNAMKSKKGFTLVELVVVIAILAILAAVAIPSVIGIINSASQSSAEANAAAIDMACKDFYTGVASGDINESNRGSVPTGVLPVTNAPFVTKITKAKTLTVKEALQYAGIYSQFPDNTKLSDFQYSNSDGRVTYKGDSGSLQAGNSQLTLETQFLNMYKNV